MKTNHRLAFALVIFTLWLAPLLGVAAEPTITIRAFYTSEPEKDRMVILIRFFDENGVKNKILDITQGAPFDSRSYQLLDEKGNPVILRPVVQGVEPNLLASNVKIVPETQLDPAQTYKFNILAGKLVFRVPVDGTTVAVTNAETRLLLEGGKFKENLDYFERERSGAGQSSLELLGGSPGGAGTARLRVDKSRFVGVSWLSARLEGRADFTLDPTRRGEYFNSISGQADLYSPIELFPNDPINRRYSEVSAHMKTESDQEFKVTDGLFGAQYAIYPKDPLTTWLGTLFVRTNTHVPALYAFGYDYAHNLAGGTATELATAGINTERADHRVRALLRWRVPVLNNADFSFLPALGGRFDVDLDLELKGIYDINAEKFLDQSRVSLVFTKGTESNFKPALVFTWARGKEGPTWKEINALLAGLRISF